MSRITSSSNNGSYLYIDYTYTQNVAGNYSTVSWTMGIHWGTYYFRVDDALINFSTTVSGASLTGSTSTGTVNTGWPISGSGPNRDHVLKSGTTVVHHNDSSGAGNIRFVGSAFWDTPSNFTASMNSTATLSTIPRDSSAPSTPVISSITSTTMVATFHDGTGGAEIDSRQLAYSTNSSTKSPIVSSDGSTTLTGLTPGTTYYIWARTHNAAGYSAWSGRATATTLGSPSPPTAPLVNAVTQSSAVVTWDPPAANGSPITGYEVGYSTTDVSPTTSMSATSPKTVTGLDASTTYYIRVRAQNAVGFSAWSAATVISTLAAAHIRIGGVWKDAVPFVTVSGTPREAVPWVKVSGVWKKAS
jgi:hypothetical protein